MCPEAGMTIWVQLLGARTPKIWEGKKRPKLGAISDSFRLWSRMSPVRIEISKIGKAGDQLQHSHVKRKKLDELWSINKKVIGSHADAPKINTARAV